MEYMDLHNAAATPKRVREIAKARSSFGFDG
jgi:hypothetical protein